MLRCVPQNPLWTQALAPQLPPVRVALSWVRPCWELLSAEGSCLAQGGAQ